MANFTTTEANNCIISQCDARVIGGTHDCFVIMVEDNNGIFYRWTDSDLADDATAAQKKTAIADYLETIEKEPTPTVPVHTPDADVTPGTKVSDI